MKLIPLTLAAAKNLRRGTILYHTINKNADGSPQRWRVNGEVKIWKSNPLKVKVPIKNGLRNYGYITEYDLGLVLVETRFPVVSRAKITQKDVLLVQCYDNDTLVNNLSLWFTAPDRFVDKLPLILKYDAGQVLSLAKAMVNRNDIQDKFVLDSLYLALTMG